MKIWPFSKKATTYQDNLSPNALLEKLIANNISSSSGVAVTLTNAMGVVAVLSCARVIAKGLAQVPLKLHRPLEKGGSEVVKDGVGRLLFRRPNKYQTAFRFRYMMGMHLSLTGRFVAYTNRVAGEPVELLPFRPEAVDVRGTDWEPEFWVRFGNSTQHKKISPEKILYVVAPTFDGVNGLDIVKLARDAIGLSIATSSHAGKFFQKGAASGGLFSTDENLGKEQRDALIEALKEMEDTSTGGAYKNLLLWGGLKYQHRSYAPDQAQLREIRNQQIEEVARAFDVNPIMIGHTGDKTPTYASAEQLFIAHVVHTMGQWYELVEQELDCQLLTEDQQNDGWYWKHNVKGLMRGSHKERGEYYSKMSGIGVYNPNEIRAYEDENPYEGGNEYRVAMNTEKPGADDNASSTS
ncbi:MAG: phage portal protein [Candidatus Thiodiazotropha sp.]